MHGPRETVDTRTKWIVERWAEELGRTLHAMTDDRPEIAWIPVTNENVQSGPDWLILDVVLSVHSQPVLWLASPPLTNQALGSKTLTAAGLEEPAPEDIRNTCLELLQQCQAGLTQAISRQWQRAVSSQARESSQVPAHCEIFQADVSWSGAPSVPLYLAFDPGLLASFASANSETVVDDESPSGDEPEIPAHAPGESNRTLDVLLDVSLPVSISFGRTSMQIKEVLKLTTGSIVELNRLVTEPVDVVINDSVIARGEVVVIDGNYGVRIHEIVSRQERLSTGGTVLAINGRGEQSGVQPA